MVESYSLSQFTWKMDWNRLSLKYKDKSIENVYVVFLDGVRFITVTPDIGSVKFPAIENLSYQYMLKDSIDFYVENLFFNMKHSAITPNKYQKETFLKNVVLFNNQNEMKQVNNIISEQINILKNESNLINDEIKSAKDKLKLELDNDSDELSEENIRYMLEQVKNTRFIKKYLNEN